MRIATRKIIIYTVAFLLEKQSSYAVVAKLAKLMAKVILTHALAETLKTAELHWKGAATANDISARQAATHEDTSTWQRYPPWKDVLSTSVMNLLML